ncbi:MAG TPA: hypothetical protein VKE94_01440 [Gemmataceae bacterium]|nr:hypothetical protein [Gemmataceae bacterium]
MRSNIFYWRSLALGLSCVLVLLAAAAAPVPAATPSPSLVPSALIVPLESPGSTALPLAADRFGWFWTFLENTIHSRARMLQLGVIGMCIALYFMYRARG